MGIAAYNRGSEVIANRCRLKTRHPAFDIMDRINSSPKNFPPHAMRRPFGPLVIEHDKHHDVWWLMCATKLYGGFSYCYPSLRMAVQSWDIDLTGYDQSLDRWTTTTRSSN